MIKKQQFEVFVFTFVTSTGTDFVVVVVVLLNEGGSNLNISAPFVVDVDDERRSTSDVDLLCCSESFDKRSLLPGITSAFARSNDLSCSSFNELANIGFFEFLNF